MLGVNHETVGAVRREMEGRGEIRHVSTVKDSLGREQPRQRERSATDENHLVPIGRGGRPDEPEPQAPPPKPPKTTLRDGGDVHIEDERTTTSALARLPRLGVWGFFLLLLLSLFLYF